MQSTSLSCVRGHNQFTNTKFTCPNTKISKSIYSQTIGSAKAIPCHRIDVGCHAIFLPCSGLPLYLAVMARKALKLYKVFRQDFCRKLISHLRGTLTASCTELAKKVCPRLRYSASGRGATSPNLGQTFSTISVDMQ